MGQSVQISAIPVKNATGQHAMASHSNYHPTGAELYFWEIGHLQRGTTSKQHQSAAPNSSAHTLLNTAVLPLSLSEIKFIWQSFAKCYQGELTRVVEMKKVYLEL